MNRPIKFRFYDHSIKAMLTPSCVGEYGFYAEDRDFEDGRSLPLDRLMQFTGLKDKNGREIFEGDIVEAWSEGYKHTGEIRWRLEGQPAIIIYPAFANQGFWKIHGQKNLKGEMVDDGVTVIGNIYQDKHLIGL
jgi:uncharacterized phage protein (TIGR01671 family)